MITTLLIIGILLVAAGLGTFWFGVRHAVIGYEDESGFHEGVQAKSAAISEAVRESVAA